MELEQTLLIMPDKEMIERMTSLKLLPTEEEGADDGEFRELHQLLVKVEEILSDKKSRPSGSSWYEKYLRLVKKAPRGFAKLLAASRAAGGGETIQDHDKKGGLYSMSAEDGNGTQNRYIGSTNNLERRRREHRCSILKARKLDQSPPLGGWSTIQQFARTIPDAVFTINVLLRLDAYSAEAFSTLEAKGVARVCVVIIEGLVQIDRDTVKYHQKRGKKTADPRPQAVSGLIKGNRHLALDESPLLSISIGRMKRPGTFVCVVCCKRRGSRKFARHMAWHRCKEDGCDAMVDNSLQRQAHMWEEHYTGAAVEIVR